MAKSRERKREISSKLNGLRMRRNDSYPNTKISRIDGRSILTNSSTKIVGARQLS
jgi:hypothetical protein